MTAGRPWSSRAIRLVLFDLDDTLCDYAGSRDARLRRAFSLADPREMGRDGVDDDLDRLVAESVAMNPHGSDHFPELFRRHRLGEPDTAMAWYGAHRFLGLELFPDALETIEAARTVRWDDGRTLGRGVGLVTNGPADTQRAKLELLELSDAVDFAVVSGAFGVWKPDPAIFAEALRRGGARADETVVVGDSPEFDMVGAQRAGIPSIWVNRGGREWPLEAPEPDQQVSDLAGVRRLLASS